MNESSPVVESLPGRPVSGQTAEGPSVRPLEVPSLAQVLAEIRTDSQRQSEKYLTDTVVPHGGE
jgi:hypothetical protein